MARVLMNLAKVKVSLAGNPIFDDVSLELQLNQKIGFVGPNGAGKSTLMKVMSQEIVADDGELFRAPGLTWARLEQEPVMEEGRSVLEEALTAVPELARVEEQIHQLEARMADPAVYEN